MSEQLRIPTGQHQAEQSETSALTAGQISAVETLGVYLTCSQAAALCWLPRRRLGKRTHATTIVRWITKGKCGVKLQAQRFGDCYLTTEFWLRQFFSQCDRADREASAAAVPAAAVPTARQAARALDAAGIQ